MPLPPRHLPPFRFFQTSMSSFFFFFALSFPPFSSMRGKFLIPLSPLLLFTFPPPSAAAVVPFVGLIASLLLMVRRLISFYRRPCLVFFSMAGPWAGEVFGFFCVFPKMAPSAVGKDHDSSCPSFWGPNPPKRQVIFALALSRALPPNQFYTVAGFSFAGDSPIYTFL